jgi:hypothetical protein
VAFLALKLAYFNMLSMVEISKVGQAMDFYPFYWLAIFKSFFYLGNFWRILTNVGVAIHAHRSWRNTSMAAGFGTKVTVQALDLVVAGMNLVRE